MRPRQGDLFIYRSQEESIKLYFLISCIFQKGEHEILFENDPKLTITVNATVLYIDMSEFYNKGTQEMVVYNHPTNKNIVQEFSLGKR